jgi:hypothetical protein
MTFLSIPQLLKALVVAVVVAVLGYLLYPHLGLDATVPIKAFVLILAAGAFAGGMGAAINIGEAVTREATGSGESVSVFVGNLSFKASPDELRQLFSPYGEVRSVRIMKDRATRRPRGFAFIEMGESQASKAIKALDGREFLGRSLRVNTGVERSQQDD